LAQYSNTPSLRVAGFEDEDDDENEAPHEWGRLFQHDHPKLSHRSKHPALIQHHTFGRHFQGDLGVLPHPGLKPWAILLDHFMVKNWQR
jgi:hypothetical protein